MKIYLKMFVALVAMFAIVGCNNEPEPTPPTGEEALCTLSVEATAITDTTIEFSITSENADEVRYIFAQSSETYPSKETILEEGTEVDANKSATVQFEELTPNTKYILHVAAKNSIKNSIYTTYAYQEAQTEEAVGAYLSFEVANITESSAELTITSTNAIEVKYLVVAEADGTPSNDDIAANGESVEPNTEVKVTLTDLVAGTLYNIYGLATGENSRAEAHYNFATITPAPTLSASLTEDIGDNYVVFSIAAEHVTELKFVCIKAGSRDVTAEQVLKNGTSVEPGDVKIEGLTEETAYEIYVAAKGLNEEVVMADVLTFATIRVVKNYFITDNATASSYKYEDNNYYVTFIDETQGYTLCVDFFTDNSQPYLTSGSYVLGDMTAGNISEKYTKFMFSPTDTTGETFIMGDLDVQATANEDTREINYTIRGILTFANGDYVYVDFNGVISGISLPAPVDPGAPEGAYVFEVSPETSMPKRVHGSNLQAGEYYIKFYDSNWNELTLDLFVDPTLCNNGSDALPAGIYSTADGSLDTYSNISLYNPYFAGNFTEAELEVSIDGDDYTFTLLGTVASGSTEKVVYMSYTGKIEDMVK